MAFASKNITDKIFAALLPVAIFFVSGFEHVFMLPTGTVIEHFASPEFRIKIGEDPSTFADISISNFILQNLIPVTIGNMIGGGLMLRMFYIMSAAKNKI